MTRFFPFRALACFGLLLTSCQAPSPAPEPEVDATAEEIVDVVQDLFQAMEARDSVRIKMALHPEAFPNVLGELARLRRLQPESAIVAQLIDSLKGHPRATESQRTALDAL